MHVDDKTSTSPLMNKKSFLGVKSVSWKMKYWMGKSATPGYLQDTILCSINVTRRKNTRSYNIQIFFLPAVNLALFHECNIKSKIPRERDIWWIYINEHQSSTFFVRTTTTTDAIFDFVNNLVYPITMTYNTRPSPGDPLMR